MYTDMTVVTAATEHLVHKAVVCGRCEFFMVGCAAILRVVLERYKVRRF